MAKESFAQKCSVVLEEMRAEAVAKILRVQNNESSDVGQDECQSPILSVNHPRQETFTNQRREVQMEETAFFGREWNDMNLVSLSDFIFVLNVQILLLRFKLMHEKGQSAPRDHALFSIFNGLDGIRAHEPSASGGMVDRIDRWGFSSLTGY